MVDASKFLKKNLDLTSTLFPLHDTTFVQTLPLSTVHSLKNDLPRSLQRERNLIYPQFFYVRINLGIMELPQVSKKTIIEDKVFIMYYTYLTEIQMSC